MPTAKPPYPPEFRSRMVELARAGRTPAELAWEFEPSAEALRNWAKQADLCGGKRSDGLTTQERKEIVRLCRKNRKLRKERDTRSNAAAWFVRRPGSRYRIRSVPVFATNCPLFPPIGN